MTFSENEVGANPRVGGDGHLTWDAKEGPHYPCAVLPTSL